MESHGHIELIDVQPFLERVCEGMQVGELLHGENFSLHDAMVAIEIGDLKMDVGLRRGDTRSAAELIAAGAAPADLPLRTQLAVLDRLLCMEATWQGGIMLSQTVFTSLYVLEPGRLKESAPALHAGCLGVRSACTLLHDAGMSGQVVDDEDMLLHVFGFRLDIPGPEAVTTAKNAMTAALEGLGGSGDADAAAMALRLRFRLKLLQILGLMHPASDDSIGEVPDLCAAACRLLDAMAAAPVPEEELAAAPGFAPEVHRKAMGLAPPRPVNVAPFADTVGRWSSTLRALGNACAWLAGCASWGELRSRLVDFAAAPENLPLTRSLLHRAIVGPMRSADAAAAGAAAKATGGLSDGSGARASSLPRWCPSQAMIAAEFGWAVDAPPPGPDAALFLEQCAIAAQGLVHTLCLNRCRQRRRLRRLLEDWTNMTDHAFNVEISTEAREWFSEHGWTWTPEDVEGTPLPGPVTAWVEREAAAAATAHLMLGFQLDLYAPHEFTAVYWYCDYLIGAGQSAGEELHGMRPAPAPPAAPPASKGKGGKGKAGRKATLLTPSPEVVAAEERAAVASVVARVDRQMCQGAMRLALGLTWLGLVAPPSAPFNSAKERFAQRFRCLEQLPRPPPLSFDDLERSTAPGDVEAARVLLAAYEAFAQAVDAANMLEQGPLAARLPAGAGRQLAGVKRIAAQNMMGLKLLINSLTGPKAVQRPPFAAGWDFKVAAQHSGTAFFPSLVLKSAKALK